MSYSAFHWSTFNISARIFGFMSLLIGLAFCYTGIMQIFGADLPTPGVSALGNLVVSIFCILMSIGFLTVQPYRPDIPKGYASTNGEAPKTNWWTGAVSHASDRKPDQFKLDQNKQILVEKIFYKQSMFISAIAAVLAISALMSIAETCGVFGPSEIGATASIVHGLPEPIQRLISLTIDTLTIALAFGIFKRYLLAWRVGMVFIVIDCSYSTINSLQSKKTLHFLFSDFHYIFAIVSVLLGIVCLNWWYFQRSHFVKTIC